MTEKDGFIYPEFSPNQNPFENENSKGNEINKAKESNEIFDVDESGDYHSLYGGQE